MKLKMHENSLFAVLLRSPWWVSFLIAGALFAGLRLVVAPLYAGFFALPFLVIGAYAAWQQLRAPSAASVAAALEALRAMDAAQFAAALEEGLRRDGYEVTRLAAEDADLELHKGGRLALLSCKRWKAAHAGTEPLRRLKALAQKQAAAQEREAPDCIYVSAGELSPKALAYAAQENIRLIYGAELARLLPRGKGKA